MSKRNVQPWDEGVLLFMLKRQRTKALSDVVRTANSMKRRRIAMSTEQMFVASAAKAIITQRSKRK